ncbi:hypothetical protein H310_13880 [Aphanomyces invadans]|uniref:Uncharacterized protein n=1 Tax=Aphanomyces invadans TaxID=157072 RepID=A0A024TE51_9STRA|nr:hypothetical protein H310_13880 [Aphanomyces invadans]ETV91632.1 hypothetical protein H310_13880 [Aphanomyces invadans]|eukprot:XP_008879751.1 hypothetical protein H310_13880 [Aphanomyces invadans]
MCQRTRKSSGCSSGTCLEENTAQDVGVCGSHGQARDVFFDQAHHQHESRMVQQRHVPLDRVTRRGAPCRPQLRSRRVTSQGTAAGTSHQRRGRHPPRLIEIPFSASLVESLDNESLPSLVSPTSDWASRGAPVRRWLRRLSLFACANNSLATFHKGISAMYQAIHSSDMMPPPVWSKKDSTSLTLVPR